MNSTILGGLGLVGILALGACAAPAAQDGAEPVAQTYDEAPAEEAPAEEAPAEEAPAEEQAQATDEYSFTELNFDEAMSMTQGEGEGLVTVGRPTPSECIEYPPDFCESELQPEVGDRIVQTTVTIENTGTVPLEFDNQEFILEFADGRQMEESEGNALHWGPDGSDLDARVRPNSTYRGIATFEAPDGPFSILMLSEAYGDAIVSWS